MKTPQWRWAVENRCVFSARLKMLSDRSGDRSAGGRRFHVAGLLTAKRCTEMAVVTIVHECDKPTNIMTCSLTIVHKVHKNYKLSNK